MRKILALFLLTSLLAGCSHQLGKFTIWSTHNVELQIEHSPVKRNVKASSMTTTILIFSFGKPDLEQALDKLLRKHNADFLTNVILYQKSWSIILYGRSGYVIIGDAWRNGPAPVEEHGMNDRITRESEFEVVWDEECDVYRLVVKG